MPGSGRLSRPVWRRSRVATDAGLSAQRRGRRLRPLTLHQPKPLLTIGGETLIDATSAPWRGWHREAGSVSITLVTGSSVPRCRRALGRGASAFREQELLDTAAHCGMLQAGLARNRLRWSRLTSTRITASGCRTWVMRTHTCWSSPIRPTIHRVILPCRTGMLSREGAREFTYSGIAVVHPRFVGHERRPVFRRDCMFNAAAAGVWRAVRCRASGQMSYRASRGLSPTGCRDARG